MNPVGDSLVQVGVSRNMVGHALGDGPSSLGSAVGDVDRLRLGLLLFVQNAKEHSACTPGLPGTRPYRPAFGRGRELVACEMGRSDQKNG